MRTLVISSALIILVVCSARANGDYETKVMAEPGFAQSELDRLSRADPIDTARALAEFGARTCDLPRLPIELEEYVGGTGRNRYQQLVVAKAVIALGYPTPGDHSGKCERVRAALVLMEKSDRWCRDVLERTKSGQGIRTCF